MSHEKGTVKPLPNPGNKIGVKLNFVLAARDLPRTERGCVGSSVADPYVKLSHKDHAATKDWTEFGKTDHQKNTLNPDWLNVFSFHWIQGAGQLWHFDLMDHDVLSRDDLIGQVEVDVDNYVLKKDQQLSITFSSGGTLHIKRTMPTTFRLSANNLPKLDPLEGPSDPFVECYWSCGQRGPTNLFAKTKVIKNVENADWEDEIEFGNYQPGTNQYWTFKVIDYDTVTKSDPIGEVSMSVDAFVTNAHVEILSLSKDKLNKATLTVTPGFMN